MTPPSAPARTFPTEHAAPRALTRAESTVVRAQHLLRRLGNALASPRARWAAPIAGVCLTLASLGGGVVRGDDSLQLLKARGVFAQGLPARLDLFDFVPGTAAGNAHWADIGLIPWFASPNLRLSFFRPLSSLSAFFDYTVLAGAPWLIHAESVALYAALIAVVGAAYRRLLPMPVAALAALLFALDDAHTFPVGWLADRNALFAGVFAVAAWIAHDRWRRDSWRLGAILGPLAFLASLLSAELGIATLAYLFAHALTLDPERSKVRRAAALAPYAVTAVGWQEAYRLLGYGARGSGLYVDPLTSPLGFARIAPQRFSALLLGQFAFPPSDLSAHVSPMARAGIAVAGVIVLAFLARALSGIVRRDAVARFFVLGSILATVPIVATECSDRLLVLVGFGAFGLIARVLGDLREWPGDVSGSLGLVRRSWIGIHLGIAPLLLAVGAFVPRIGGGIAVRAVYGVHLGDAIAAQTLVLVNAPNVFAVQPILFPSEEAAPRPARVRALATTASAVTLRRDGTRSVTIEVEPGTEKGEKDVVSRLFRDAVHAVHAGESFDVPGLHVDVERVGPDGEPSLIHATFDRSLDDPSMRWFAWKDGALVDFALPPIGQSVTAGPG